MNIEKELYNIHIVDDEPIYRRLLKEILNDERFSLSESPSGEHCLNHLEMKSVDVVLLDVNMDGIDGFETCRRIRKNPATRNVPVIFMTAAEKPEHVKAGYDSGGSDYVIKPFKPAIVKGRVYNIASGKNDYSRRTEIENHPPEGLSI
ncbi:MAG: response regulator [Gammaproteobacteria bacterium]|nr:MAG: response regulator [Gammaproteobacteria bacterium]